MKFLAIDPSASARPSISEQAVLIGSIEGPGAGAGLSRVILPVYLRYWQAYSTLVKCGYQVDLHDGADAEGKQEDYEDPADLVLDDWR